MGFNLGRAWLSGSTFGLSELARKHGGSTGGSSGVNTGGANPKELPSGGPYAGFDPSSYFGTTGQYGNTNPFTNVGAGDNRLGAGMYNLPQAFAGWSGAARGAFGPALDYASKVQPVADYYKGEMGKDYQADLYGRSSDIYDAQQKDASRKGQQGLARAGYGGGGAVSPFAALQVQQEAAARAGTLGSAARESVLQAQQMKSEAGRNYMNSLSSYLQAMLVPYQLQSQSISKVPGAPMGPSLWGPAMNLGASAIGAMA